MPKKLTKILIPFCYHRVRSERRALAVAIGYATGLTRGLALLHMHQGIMT
jgi:hypothetical protein